MKKYLLQLFNFKKYLFGLYLLPYLAILLPQIIHSDIFSYSKFSIVLSCFFILHIIMLKLSDSENHNVRIFIIFSFTFYLIFFYGQIIPNALHGYIDNLLSLKIRWRYILVFLGVLITAIQLVFWNKKEAMLKFINTTLLIFTISLVASNFFKNKSTNFSYDAQVVKSLNKVVSTTDKPVVLIVLDEYQGMPFKVNNRVVNDNILAEFLNKEGWQVKKKINTQEISTIHSLSSLFNFNLSGNHEFSKIPFFTADKLLRESSLIRTLAERKINFTNYSFFNIGAFNKWQQLYLIPDSFLDLFFEFSALPLLELNVNALKSNYNNKTNFATSVYNSQLLLKSHTVLNDSNLSGLTYIHFFMPHSPYQYQDEISLYNVNASNYYLYWNFCNKKIMQMLQKSNYSDRLKIIITGDHGFRSDPQINPYHTFAAFYGFNKNEIEQLKSVQDIGKLIESNF